MYNLTVDVAHTFFVGEDGFLVHNADKCLFRFGTNWESAESLAQQAAAAEANNFPHGVSTFSQSTRPDAVSALQEEVKKYFPVIKTGKNKFHYTVELPKPVTEEVANLFNSLFGRKR